MEPGLGARRAQDASLRQRFGRTPAVLPGIAIAFRRAHRLLRCRRNIIVPQKSEGVPPPAPFCPHAVAQDRPQPVLAKAPAAGQRDELFCVFRHGLDLGPPRPGRSRPGAVLAGVAVALRRPRPALGRNIIVRRNRRILPHRRGLGRFHVRDMFHPNFYQCNLCVSSLETARCDPSKLGRRPSNLDVGEQIHIRMVQKHSVSRVSGGFPEETAPAEFSDQRIGVGKADA
jgi:hypothetical protein